MTIIRKAMLLLCCAMAAGCFLTLARSQTSTTVMGVKVTIDGPAEGVTNDSSAVTVGDGGPPEEGSFGLKWQGGGAKVSLALSKKGDQSSPRTLRVNDKNYGTVNAGDEVRADGQAVWVNGTARAEEKTTP